jgi:hypothetical protein
MQNVMMKNGLFAAAVAKITPTNTIASQQQATRYGRHTISRNWKKEEIGMNFF